MKANQVGRFSVDALAMVSDLDAVAEMMKGVVVKSVSIGINQDCIDYIGISNDFDEVEAGFVVPKYEAIMQKNEIGVVTRKEWVRV